MKLIIAILLLAISTFAQNTTYKDGTECECDSITYIYYPSGSIASEVPYLNGKLNGIVKRYYESGSIKSEEAYIDGKVNGAYIDGKRTGIWKWYYESGKLAGTATYKNDKKLVAYWYNSYTSKYCRVNVTTPSDFVYTEVGYCEASIPVNKINEVLRTLKIKACKESFTASRKNNLYEYLDKCTKYTTIEYDSPSVSYMYCGVTDRNSDGTATRPSSCNYSASWFTYKRD